MKVTVLGKRVLNFKTDKGEVVQGTQIFICYPTNNVEGQLVDKVFIPINSPIKIPQLEFGQLYDFIYNGIGKRQYLTDIIKA